MDWLLKLGVRLWGCREPMVWYGTDYVVTTRKWEDWRRRQAMVNGQSANQLQIKYDELRAENARLRKDIEYARV